MRDLLRHVGGVHRWAKTYVAESRLEPMDETEEGSLMGGWPERDEELIEWFRQGHASLVHTLETADPALSCWTFLAAPSPLAFWARRQAHETAIHRADAESPREAITPFPPAFAADGIDELLSCFLTRSSGGLRADPPRRLQVKTTDEPANWLVEIGPQRVVVSPDGGAADCAVSGPASELYLLLWNRRGAEGLDVRGDRSLLEGWRRMARIRWS